MIRDFLMMLFLRIGKMFYRYIDIYSPNGNVEGITFSNNMEYINKVSEIELGEEREEEPF